MSRKFMLSLATATIIVAGLASTAADARGFGGGHSFSGGHSVGGGNGLHAHSTRSRSAALNRGGRSGQHGGGHGHNGHHHHHHGNFGDGDGIWIDGDDQDVDAGAPDVAAAPGPCTCLTKTYTPDGLVVFADVCTKEAASARVDGTATGAAPIPPTDSKASDATPTTPNPSTEAKVAEVSKAPTSLNYAGRTYADYLAANPQLTAQAPKN